LWGKFQFCGVCHGTNALNACDRGGI